MDLGLTVGPVVVVGDVFVDRVVAIDERRNGSGLASDGELQYAAPIATRVGGCGLQFAIAAREAGFEPVALIGKIGCIDGSPDDAAAMAVATLLASDVAPLLAEDEKSGTGQALVVYGGPASRLLISDPGANSTFCPEDISAAMRALVRRAGLLHVSGYALIAEPRRQATIDIIRTSKRCGAVVALDLVPHDLYRDADVCRTLDELLNLVDWLIGDKATIMRCLEVWRMTGLLELAARIPHLVAYSDSSRATVFSGGETAAWRHEHAPGSGARGSSARSQALLLYKYLGAGR